MVSLTGGNLFTEYTFVCHIIQYMHNNYFFGKMSRWIFIQPSIQVFISKMTHFLHKVGPSGHQYYVAEPLLASLIVMFVQVLSEKREFLFWLVRCKMANFTCKLLLFDRTFVFIDVEKGYICT